VFCKDGGGGTNADVVLVDPYAGEVPITPPEGRVLEGVPRGFMAWTRSTNSFYRA
jgi:hypothetical protein